MARLLQSVEAAEDVVAFDVGDPQVVAVACDQFAGCGGQPGGVEPAGVDDEPDPVRDEVLERRVEVLQERGRIALGAVLGARLAEDQHRDLGEVVAGEDVDAAGPGHVGHGRSAVTVEAGAVPDADRDAVPVAVVLPLSPVGRSSRLRVILLTHTVPSKPTSPEGLLLDELEGHAVALGRGHPGGVGQIGRRVDGLAQPVGDLRDAATRGRGPR